MRKWSRIRFIPVLALPFCLVLSPLAQEKKEAEGIYTIKSGDTLWEISSEFLKDPFRWPKLWQWNPYITNPHQIYPGQPIRLSPPEELKKQELQRPVVEEKRKEIAPEPEMKKVEPPQREKKPEEVIQAKPIGEKPETVEEKPKPVEEKPKTGEEKPKVVEEKPVVFPEVRSAGFFNDVDYRGIGILLESKEGKTLMGDNDIVYVAFKTPEPILIGNKYTVFRASELIPHPTSGKKIGRRYNIIGTIQIIDHYGRFHTAKVIEVFDAILKGDFIRAYAKEKMEVEQGKK